MPFASKGYVLRRAIPSTPQDSLAHRTNYPQRIKCDETIPSCEQCVKRRVECPGYHKIIKWSNKYERLRNHSDPTHPQSLAKIKEREPRQISLTPDAGPYDLDELVNLVNDADYTSNRSVATNDIGELDPGLIVDGHGHVYSSDSTSLTQQSDIDDLSVITPALETETDLLSKHYFSLVCIINSGFDSPANPFRAYVAELMCADTIIYHCMLSMSAAHLYQHDKNFKEVALKYRTEAICCLRAKLTNTSGQKHLEIESHSQLSTLLFGTLLLGMSSVSYASDP